MHVALAPGHRPVGEVARGLPRQQRDLPADHRRVDHLPLTGALARVQRSDDSEGREHTRDHVGLRDADHDRFAAGLAGEAHDPAHPLHDEVVRRPRAAGSILTEAADMADDRAPVDRADAIVGEAETREHTRAEVLNDDV